MTRVIYESQFGPNPDGTWWYTVTLHHLGHYWTSRGVTFDAADEDAAHAHVVASVRALADCLQPGRVRTPALHQGIRKET